MSRWITKFLEENQPDKPDRFNLKMNLSGLSVPPQGLLGENLENEPETRTDTFGTKTKRPMFSSLRDSFEECLAIAEYDGQQTEAQTQRIAYLEAFTTVLTTLPYEEKGPYDDWLMCRIKATQNGLKVEGLYQPE